MTGRTQARVDIASIMAMHEPEGPPLSVHIFGHGDDVNMVGHQAIGPDRHARLPRSLRQQIDIQRIIAIFKKRPLPPVATLRDVMRDAWKDEARKAGHDAIRFAPSEVERHLGINARVTVITPQSNMCLNPMRAFQCPTVALRIVPLEKVRFLELPVSCLFFAFQN